MQLLSSKCLSQDEHTGKLHCLSSVVVTTSQNSKSSLYFNLLIANSWFCSCFPRQGTLFFSMLKKDTTVSLYS